MSRYQRYPAYKDSGVEWIGEIPEHWKCIKIKHLSQVQRGASPRPIDDPKYFDDEGEYSWVRISDVTASNKYLECSEQRLSDIGKQLSVPLQPGKLFLSIAGSVGKPIITKINCCIHDGFVYFPYLKECTDFLYYIFASGQPYLGLGKMGTQLNLNTDTVGSISIPLPPLEEQQAIVSFLDRKTAQIDELITKKEELLKKLDEKRTALITQAVTKGLDQSGPMKNSGVAWIGEIPRHWEVKRLKQTMLLITNKSCAETQNVALENIESWSGKYIPSDTEFEGDGVTFQVGDILFGKLRPYLAKAYLAEFPGAAVGDFHVMRPITTSLHGRYTLYLILSHGVISIIDGSTFGAKMPRVSWDFMGNIPLPVPPLDEQRAIAEQIEKKTATIDRQKVQVNQAIERLKEYRTALITDAVTGKMDVHSIGKMESMSD
ncbi:MAG: restriction endonuclease subunit S [Chlorobiales bacterium]|nr:restriction endonuclease subunit S [Chlorobiales bacterium]